MAVAYKASGTFTAGIAAVTPPYPTAGNAPVAGDVALLVITSENEAISLTTANGFALLGSATSKAAGTAATDPGTRLVVYWKRCTGSDSAPVVADSGNNTEAQIHLFSGCRVVSNPWDVFAEGNDSAANDTSGSIPSTTTTVANTLIVLLCSTSVNATGTANFSSWTNANLGSLTERADASDTSGLGGGHGMATGTYVGPGDYGASTVTLAATSFKGTMSIALAPEVSPTVALNTPADAATGQSTTPTLNFTGTDLNADTVEYQVQIDTVNTFDSVASGFDLKYADLWLTKSGAPSDNLFLEVRSVSISGSILGTSAAVAASTASGSGGSVRFTFSTPVTLAAATQYFLVLRRSGTNDVSNGAFWSVTTTDVYSGGSYWINNSGTWSQSATKDARFLLYDTSTTAQVTQNAASSQLDGPTGGTASGQEVGQSFTVATVGPLINAASSADAGFTAGHPFASGAAKDYTVQSALSAGVTYYWRVRAIDPLGSNTYGAYATTRSFTTSGGSTPISASEATGAITSEATSLALSATVNEAAPTTSATPIAATLTTINEAAPSTEGTAVSLVLSPVNETAPATEALALTIQTTSNEASPATEAQTLAITSSLNEAAPATEALTLAVLLTAINESGPATESIAVALVLSTINEAGPSTSAQSLVIASSLNESAPATESATLAISASLAESGPATEATSLAVLLTAINESIAATESVLVALVLSTINEAGPSTAAQAVTIQTTTNEAAPATSGSTLSITSTVAESAPSTETLGLAAALTAINETAPTTESASIVATGTTTNVSASETAPSAQAVSLSISTTIGEASPATEAVTLSLTSLVNEAAPTISTLDILIDSTVLEAFSSLESVSIQAIAAEVPGLCFGSDAAGAIASLSDRRILSVTNEIGAISMQSAFSPMTITDSAAAVTIGDRKQ